jgi:Ser/Thr protein kinase RdoA (MazF antagonist)
VYRALAAQRAAALAPRLLDVMHVDATELLFLEWVRPVCAWPWRDVHAAGQVLVCLARLHQWPWEAGAPALRPWAYDAALYQSGQATLDTLQWVIRERGATPWQAAVPMTTRLVAALSEIRHVLFATASHVSWIHGDMHPGNVILRRGGGCRAGAARLGAGTSGSFLEDVSAWVQSLGHWEPQARRFHDTLLRTYLAARGLEPVLPRDFRRLYGVAGACNALAGALQYHLRMFAHARTPTTQASARTLV